MRVDGVTWSTLGRRFAGRQRRLSISLTPQFLRFTHLHSHSRRLTRTPSHTHREVDWTVLSVVSAHSVKRRDTPEFRLGGTTSMGSTSRNLQHPSVPALPSFTSDVRQTLVSRTRPIQSQSAPYGHCTRTHRLSSRDRWTTSSVRRRALVASSTVEGRASQRVW